ncbi:MAG: polyketide cyclase [Anaerolineae bacterium]
MASNDYQFVTHWRVQSSVQEITEVLGGGTDLTRWWPSVYLEVRQLEKGDENGVGSVIDLHTKGWLPYHLRWQFRVTETHHPYGFSLEAWGDFVGKGVWTFAQDGEWVNISYDWTIRADKPLLRDLSWIMKPLFSMNHRWAMAMGERSLELELQRRHAKTPEEAALVPAPPPPTSDEMFVFGGLGIGAMLVWLLKPRKN